MEKVKTPRVFRIVIALFLGAAIGSSISSIEYLAALYQNLGAEHFKDWALSKGIRFFVFAFYVWLIAICLFGGTAWGLLHKSNRCEWFHAVSVGIAIPFVIVLVALISFGWKIAFTSAFSHGIYGAIISWVVWIICYGKPNSRKRL